MKAGNKSLGLALILALLAIMTGVALTPTLSLAQERPVIAVAATLQYAAEEIATAFTQETGEAVTLVFGASGNLSRQIRQAAPFQMLLAADEDYVLGLARDGLTRDEGMVYATGRLVLVVPNGSPIQADAQMDDLAAALSDGRLQRFAIANPNHAPYGQRAMEALRHRGLWDAIQPFLVLGENISQAAQFAVSGNAQAGIIAYSLALSSSLQTRSQFGLIPESWHAPLRQRMVLLTSAGPVAAKFYDYLQQPTARAILKQYGYDLPGEG